MCGSPLRRARPSRTADPCGQRCRCAIILALVLPAASSCGGAASSAAGNAATTPAPDTGARLVQPGAPGAPTRDVQPDDVRRVSGSNYTRADVHFMQGMIPHHAQALEMVELIADRTDSEELRQLGLRIEISQRDEIQLMERWLRKRREALPAHSHTDHDGAEAAGRKAMGPMPGMLTPEQMSELRAARGVEFERLFLEHMIRHHGGARVMVRELFASPGAGQESRIFAFASDVDADQLMEIGRMKQMLERR